MNPTAYSYRGGVITQTAPFIFRADMDYKTIGHYSTMSTARAAVTRAHKAKLSDMARESSAYSSVPEYRDIVTKAAELARSTASRLACMGISRTLHIHASKHELHIHYEGDAPANWVYVGCIKTDVPYVDYWQRIYDMARNAPLY